MRLYELTGYSYEELNTFTVLLSEAKSDWETQTSTAYKKGLKKHQNDESVRDNLEKLLDFIENHDGIPAIRSYPPELNVHPLTGPYSGYLDAHLKGQKIILIFSIEAGQLNPKADSKKPETKWLSKNKLILKHLGTHQELPGWR